jgi:hypothetical protein
VAQRGARRVWRVLADAVDAVRSAGCRRCAGSVDAAGAAPRGVDAGRCAGRCAGAAAATLAHGARIDAAAPAPRGGAIFRRRRRATARPHITAHIAVYVI